MLVYTIWILQTASQWHLGTVEQSGIKHLDQGCIHTGWWGLKPQPCEAYALTVWPRCSYWTQIHLSLFDTHNRVHGHICQFVMAFYPTFSSSLQDYPPLPHYLPLTVPSPSVLTHAFICLIQINLLLIW